MKKIIVLAAVVLAIGGTASATWEHDKCLNIEGIQGDRAGRADCQGGECWRQEPIVNQPAAQPDQ
jgi:hypothetical protein